MRKQKQVTVEAIYCDLCGLEGISWGMEFIGDGTTEKHYHRHYINGEKESCFDKYEKTLIK